eukprot:symbB.v1.2.036402.t1/scaffold5130.1/size31091/2
MKQGWMPRSKKTGKYKQMILKAADTLDQRPFLKHEAAEALRCWVEERNELHPALNVSYCKLAIGLAAPSTLTQTLTDNFEAGAVDGGDNVPAGLEPSMGKVIVKYMRPKGGSAAKEQGQQNHDRGNEIGAPTKKAMFVYPLAVSLASNHNLTFDRALVKAEECWKRCPPQLRQKLPTDLAEVEGDDDERQPLLDLEIDIAPRGE